MKTSSFLQYMSMILLACILFPACKNSKKEPAAPKKDTLIVPVKRTEKTDDKPRPPIINIIDTLAPRRIVIFAKDSAKTYERIGMKLGKVYGTKLAESLKKNKLKMTGAPLAWYKTTKAPYYFEAGIQVDKKPAKAVNSVQVREMPAGNVVVAHFYGPYDMMSQGYDAIREWMKVNKKSPAGAPYEIYITDPIGKDGKPIDPYKVLTDIVFPVK
ncbi:MAG TPA: hypothetical protein DCQ97_04000 [Chitinophagaceae bacterium]|nr:hypothetical protein [Chitinophagaceae bacterium]